MRAFSGPRTGKFRYICEVKDVEVDVESGIISIDLVDPKKKGAGVQTQVQIAIGGLPVFLREALQHHDLSTPILWRNDDAGL